MNLDALSRDELATLRWEMRGLKLYQLAKKFFKRHQLPVTKADGYTKTFTLLRDYVGNKEVAVNVRGRGEIATAMEYEARCEKIYAQLPVSVKW